MNLQIKGVNGSFFHNSLIILRKNDQDSGRAIIKETKAGDDIVCSLNGYAIVPIEEYYDLKGKEIPIDTDEKIKEMNAKLAEI